MIIIKDKVFKSKDKVIAATLDEFSEYSFKDASLNRIIKASGISKGTFYYHFENKEALYFYLLKIGVDAKWEFINEQTGKESADFDKMDIFDKFLNQAITGMLFAYSHPKYYKLTKMFSKEKGTSIYVKALSYLKADTHDILDNMIKDAIANKEVNPNYDEDFVRKILGHMFSVYDEIFYNQNDLDLDIVTKNLESYITFLKYGFKGRE